MFTLTIKGDQTLLEGKIDSKAYLIGDDECASSVQFDVVHKNSGRKILVIVPNTKCPVKMMGEVNCYLYADISGSLIKNLCGGKDVIVADRVSLVTRKEVASINHMRQKEPEVKTFENLV